MIIYINYIINKFYLKLFLCIILILYYFIINYRIFIISSKKQNIKVNLVVPVIFKDFHKLHRNFKFFIKYLDCVGKLVLIGDEEMEKIIENNSNFNISFQFINQKNLVNITKVQNLMKKKGINSKRKSGWYIQQFLKMEYSKICNSQYYLIWDSDTIPIRKISMFDEENKPYFDVKTEYWKAYFRTLKKIFPELGKIYNFSFISEHMMIKTEIMKNLVNKIESNKSLKGETWYEKVINSIALEDLNKSGFSEFETYGTFTNIYYNNSYAIRPWKSLRKGDQYFDPNNLNESIFVNISKIYDAISFEK